MATNTASSRGKVYRTYVTLRDVQSAFRGGFFKVAWESSPRMHQIVEVVSNFTPNHQSQIRRVFAEVLEIDWIFFFILIIAHYETHGEFSRQEAVTF